MSAAGQLACFSRAGAAGPRNLAAAAWAYQPDAPTLDRAGPDTPRHSDHGSSQKNGEFVRLIVPVGDLVARAVHAVSRAQHRRAERKAHQEVLRTLQSFQAQLPAR